MKQPLYALLVAPGHKTRTSILYGGKNISIREGHRDYRAGNPVMLCCHIEPWVVMAVITEVRHCTLAEVTEKECLDDGCQNNAELLAALKRFYPNLTMDSPITIIRWDNVRGWLKDNDVEYRFRPQTLYSRIQPE